MTRRVLVTGSRTWTDATTIRQALAEVWGDGTAVLVRIAKRYMHVPRELVTAIAAEVGALMWANTDDD